MYNTRTMIILPFTKYSVNLNWKEKQLIQALPLYSHKLLCVMGFDSAIASCCLICLVLPTIVLQTCGVFSSSWIKHNNNSECYRGVISTTGCPHGVKSNVKCLKKMCFFLNETLLTFDKMLQAIEWFWFVYILYFTGLGDTVLGLKMASFAIIGLTTTSTIWFICCKHDDDEDNPEGCLLLSGCMVCLYLVAGIVHYKKD